MLSADDIDRASFTEVRFREGYDIDEVNAFLATLRDSIAAGPSAVGVIGSADVTRMRFQPTKFRPGYDQTQVDVLLTQAEGTLRAYGR